MKQKFIKLTLIGTAVLTTAGMVPVNVFADSAKPFVSLGADLTKDQRATVLSLLGITEDDLKKDNVITVTNQDEHDYLDSYLSSSVIGTKALSSVAVWEESDGYGVQVTTHNISYCTTGMYQNALVTAGLENAKVVVAGPFELSGTAALVGAIKAYGEMTGSTIKAENIDAATEELVVTGEVADDIGSDEATELVGAVKDAIVSEDISDRDDIEKVIEDAADQMEISLSDEDKKKIADLMESISGLDLDVNQLKEQAQGLYDKLSDLDLNLNISKEEAQGFFAKLAEAFTEFLNKISSLFS